MKTSIIPLAVLAFCCACLAPESAAQDHDAVYLIFDASGSMWGELPDKSRKVTVAKQVLQDFVAGDFAGYDLALRVYGHRREGDCRDSQLVVPFGPPEQAVGQVQAFMQGLNPLGKTPISYSLRQALEDFGARGGEIILISDGIETCDEDPCALVRAWREKDIPIRMHVVGLGLDEQAKTAMQCIAEAAGTEYRDAADAATLAEGLQKIQEETKAAPPPRAVTTGFFLKGRDAEGRAMRVAGTLSRDGKELFEVVSHRRNQVESGAYTLTAGVPTANGTLYQPVTKQVEARPEGETTVEVEVAVPPSVYAVFKDPKAPQRGSLVSAFQQGKEAFKFRWIDTVYVEPGTYEFRARPNADNDLSVTAAVAPGERKAIVFEMARTVVVTIKMLASGSGQWFRQNYELWQDGEKKYGVHLSNGARARPGTYDLHLPSELTPYVHAGLVVTDEDKQHYDITVPAGHVTVHYLKADGTRDKEDRIWFARLEEGKRPREVINGSGKQIALTPGRYRLKGWSHKGTYDLVEFDVQEGDDKVVVLRDKG